MSGRDYIAEFGDGSAVRLTFSAARQRAKADWIGKPQPTVKKEFTAFAEMAARQFERRTGLKIKAPDFP